MTSSSPSPAPLDHLILFVPALTDANLSFLSSAGFEVKPGGTHADGLTENSLIVLEDGVYVEVIAFTSTASPEGRKGHWWGDKQAGWSDWCLGPPPVDADTRVAEINKRAGTNLYLPAQAGGRRTRDGKDLKWKVAFPVVDKEKGEARGVRPFWCEDVTERGWRVPEHSGPHPNGVTGVASIVLLSHPTKLTHYTSELAPILTASTKGSEHQFELSSPAGSTAIKVFVREPESEEEIRWVAERGEGLWEVVLKGGDRSLTVGASEGARFTFA